MTFYKVWFELNGVRTSEEIAADSPMEAYRLGQIFTDISGIRPDRILVSV